MGIGGAPEGVLTAAALRCLNGEILARLVVSTPEHEERLDKWESRTANAFIDTDGPRSRQENYFCMHRRNRTETCCAACDSLAKASARIR